MQRDIFQRGSIGLTQVKVVGVGGGGSNTIMRMLDTHIPGVEYYCINTDAHALAAVEGANIIRIGDKLTRGLGAGGRPDIGYQAAQETKETLGEALKGADLVFLTAGMGGGTGTGAAPLVAEMAKSVGALTVAIITTPFSFEGAHRAAIASEGLRALKEQTDTLIVVSNDRLLSLAAEGASVQDAFKKADEVSALAMLAISRIINVPGQINVDFADLKVIMQGAGPGIMALSRGNGQYRVRDAMKTAIANPLLDSTIEGAKGVLFVVTGGPDLTLAEVNEAGQLVADSVDPNAQIFFGMNIRPNGDDSSVEIVMIATHLPSSENGHQYSAPTWKASVAEALPANLPPFMSKPARIR